MDAATFLAQDRADFLSRLDQLGASADVAHFLVDTGSADVMVTCVTQPGGVDGPSAPVGDGDDSDNGCGGRDELVALLADHPSPWVLIPGWMSSLGNWCDLVSVLVKVSPVVLVFTREKPGTILTEGAGQSISEVTGDVATVWELLPHAPRAVWGVSTGAAVVCDLVTDKTIDADLPIVLGTPHLKIPVPKVATYLTRLPGAGRSMIQRTVAGQLAHGHHELRTRDLLRAIATLGPATVSESAAQWRQWRPCWNKMTQSIVLGVHGDRMHPLRDARAVAVAVGGHLLDFATYCDGQSVAAAQDVVSYWDYGV